MEKEIELRVYDIDKEELIKKIQQLALFAGVAEEQSVWNSYVDMNQSILEEIKGENIFWFWFDSKKPSISIMVEGFLL